MPGTLAAMDLRQEESGAGSLGWGYYSCLMACRRWSCPRPLGVVWLCHVFTGLTVQPSGQHASVDRSDNQSRGWFPTIYVPPYPPISAVNGKFLLPAYSVRYISFSLPRGLAEAGDKGCKPEPPKFPSADQCGLSRALSMRSCIACMTSSWVYDLALGSSASRRASSTSRVIRS